MAETGLKRRPGRPPKSANSEQSFNPKGRPSPKVHMRMYLAGKLHFNLAGGAHAAERAIKCWVLVRKNSLFAGSDEGAKATAVHLSFIASAKRNGINPVDWYADVLSRINNLRTSELQQLLPQNWSAPLTRADAAQ